MVLADDHKASVRPMPQHRLLIACAQVNSAVEEIAGYAEANGKLMAAIKGPGNKLGGECATVCTFPHTAMARLAWFCRGPMFQAASGAHST